MKWDSELGAIPEDFDTHMGRYYSAFINSSAEYNNIAYNTFLASDEYKVYYPAVQVDMYADNIMAETFLQMSEFIQTTNLKISNPTTTPNALIAGLRENFGLRSSVQEMTEENAGKMHVAIDYTPDDDLNLQIAAYMESTCVVASTYMVGDIEQSIVLSEGGIETYRWVAQTEQDMIFKITMKVSRNSTAATDTPEDVLSKFMANWNEFYWIGMDVEPEKYFEINRDAPYASEIITEYSLDDGTTWETSPYESPYNIKFIPTLDIANIIFT
ncbi:hypothetical protein [Vibrio algivorus]|uniref:Uncharacterized protein n=1 Tax=Vibrio algivorus TaxID=1667024 RepID=A0ABQ6EMH4_9VIBR|nr:hypothetical protein [Vibrio algivorus]GLT13916.1 hypothetical protein GCM10007931_08900 [Vibrio algivorus]